MIIHYLGLGAIKIQSQKQTIFIDPPKENFYSRRFRFKPDILLISSLRQNVKSVQGNPFIIQSPGEYQIGNSLIYGLESVGKENKDIISYYLEVEEINILHLGARRGYLSEKEMSRIGEINLLFVPIGGNLVLNDEQAVKLISEIEPEIVVPIYYQIPTIKIDLAPISKFCEEIGTEKKFVDKLNIKKKDVKGEETKVVLLRPG